MKKFIPSLRRERILGELTEDLDREPHLVNVDLAPVALAEMQLKALPVGWRESALEVVGDELDQLLARHIMHIRFHGALSYRGTLNHSLPVFNAYSMKRNR